MASWECRKRPQPLWNFPGARLEAGKRRYRVAKYLAGLYPRPRASEVTYPSPEQPSQVPRTRSACLSFPEWQPPLLFSSPTPTRQPRLLARSSLPPPAPPRPAIGSSPDVTAELLPPRRLEENEERRFTPWLRLALRTLPWAGQGERGRNGA